MKWQEGGITKGHKENLKDDGCLYHLDCGDVMYRYVYVFFTQREVRTHMYTRT